MLEPLDRLGEDLLHPLALLGYPYLRHGTSLLWPCSGLVAASAGAFLYLPVFCHKHVYMYMVAHNIYVNSLLFLHTGTKMRYVIYFMSMYMFRATREDM